MKREKKFQESGFTLIEAMVSVVILSIALTAIMGLFTINITSANLVRNNYIASGLIQEGVEVVRNLRDADWHASRAFGSFGAGAPVSDGSYIVQWDSDQLTIFADTFLLRDPVSGLFSYDTGNNTLFKRKIDIVTVSLIEKRVTVTVSWDQKGYPKSISAEEHLYDWK
ncbi:MAG: type II secretion system protein [bacterium]|nr:type II secretion system protein [bacterium]